jgi:hypothetical protein
MRSPTSSTESAQNRHSGGGRTVTEAIRAQLTTLPLGRASAVDAAGPASILDRKGLAAMLSDMLVYRSMSPSGEASAYSLAQLPLNYCGMTVLPDGPIPVS